MTKLKGFFLNIFGRDTEEIKDSKKLNEAEEDTDENEEDTVEEDIEDTDATSEDSEEDVDISDEDIEDAENETEGETAEASAEESPGSLIVKKERMGQYYKKMITTAKLLHDSLIAVEYNDFSDKEKIIISNFIQYLSDVIKNTEYVLTYKINKYNYEKLLILFIQNKTILNLIRDSIKSIFQKKN